MPSGWGCGVPRLLHNPCCSSTVPGRQTPWKQKWRCFWSPGPGAGGLRETQQKYPEEPSKGREFRCPRWTTLWSNDSFFFFFTEIQRYVSNHFQRHCFGEGGIKTVGGVIRVLYGVVNSYDSKDGRNTEQGTDCLSHTHEPNTRLAHLRTEAFGRPSGARVSPQVCQSQQAFLLSLIPWRKVGCRGGFSSATQSMAL